MTQISQQKKLVITLAFASLVSVLWVFSSQCHSEQEKPAPATEEKSTPGTGPVQVENRLKEIREILKDAEPNENEQTASQLGITLTELKERNALLRNLLAVYMRMQTAKKKQSALRQEEESQAEALDGAEESLVSEPPPYSLSVYDSYLDRLNEAKQGLEAERATENFYKRQIKDAGKEFDDAGHKVRSLKEKLESRDTKVVLLSIQWEYDFVKLERERARAVHDLSRMNLENTLINQRLLKLRIDIETRRVQWIKEHLAFAQSDLDKHMESINQRQKLLEERIGALRREQQVVDDKWLEAQRAGDEARDAAPVEKARADAFLKAREAWHDTYQRVLELHEMQVQVLSRENQLWQYRYAILRGDADSAEFDSWRKEADSFIERVERGIEVMQNYQTYIQSEVAALNKQLQTEGLDAVVREHVETRLAALQKSTERDLEFMSMVLGLRELEHRLMNEISDRQKAFSFGVKLKGLGEQVRALWEFELWVIDERSVTIKKVVITLVIFIVGMRLIRVASMKIRKHLLWSTRLDMTASAAVEKVLYYFSLLILLFFTLRMVNIPLTAFTVLGGGLAIGVGFGAQNLINNFISGFILMIERPVKLGDLIEVENTYGIVEDIGSRCTRIRTGSNVDILVPNSSFLEKNIVNWTLSDQRIRTYITVGVNYGSHTTKVKELMLKAAVEHENILTDPKPFVLFKEFGDNALIFELYFWIGIKRLMDRRIIESDIRYRIDQLFREADLVIAFPQRDIHLDTTKPLDLRIVKDNDGKI